MFRPLVGQHQGMPGATRSYNLKCCVYHIVYYIITSTVLQYKPKKCKLFELTLQRGVTSTARHSVNITCRGVTSPARHAARSHSFVYISTS